MHARIGRWTATSLFAAALLGGGAVARAGEPRVVEIEARRFQFTPGEVRLVKGEPVTLRLRSADVTHGMYVKALGIDAELSPGKTTELTITPQAAGRFTAICHHFCGAGHGNMHMVFVVE